MGTSRTFTGHSSTEDSLVSTAGGSAYALLAGRALLSLIFIFAGIGHFSQQSIGYAAAQGVPLATVAVPLSGILSLVGGLSVLVGYRAKLGAWLLILFLVPVTLMMHNFWSIQDPMAAQLHQVMFLKNLAIIGGALFITQEGAGPLSFDARRKRAP